MANPLDQMDPARRRRLAALGTFAKQVGVTMDMYEDPDQMLEDLEARQAALRKPGAAKPVYASAASSFPSYQMHLATPSEQGDKLQGMADDVMKVFSEENDSRVAQAREMRRMQHEKEIEQMRLETLIARLNQQRPSPYHSPAPGLYFG